MHIFFYTFYIDAMWFFLPLLASKIFLWHFESARIKMAAPREQNWNIFLRKKILLVACFFVCCFVVLCFAVKLVRLKI